MKLTPQASPYDGLFDILIVHDMPVHKRLINFSKIYSGKHIGQPGFQLIKANSVMFGTNGNLMREADGELISGNCASAEILPRALKVITNYKGA